MTNFLVYFRDNYINHSAQFVRVTVLSRIVVFLGEGAVYEGLAVDNVRS